MHFLLFKRQAKSTLQTNGFHVGMYDVNYATSDYQGAIKQSIN
jgi:hypothetical protein